MLTFLMKRFEVVTSTVRPHWTRYHGIDNGRKLLMGPHFFLIMDLVEALWIIVY